MVAIVVVNPTSLVMENATPGLQLLNPKHEAKGEFHLFSQFPLDVRCAIWEQALSHERLICVYLDPPGDWGEGPTPKDYVVVLSQRQIISKLFRVNKESRSCASRFYRVQLPCIYEYWGHPEENGTLYFNPELDTLLISGIEYLVKFAHDLWVHDPRHVGLLNMALDDPEVRPLYTHEKTNDRLREVVSRLRRVMFPFMQIDSNKLRRVRLPVTKNGLKPLFYRPIMSAAPIFHRQPDPRPIQAELRQVFVGARDPRVLIHEWISLVAAMGAQQDIEYRFMVTFENGGPEIRNRENALRFIQEEDKKWKERLRVPWKKVCQPGWLLNAIEETCQDANLIPQPVMGFWLFPIECLGPLPPLSKDPGTRYQGPWVFDRVTKKGKRPGCHITKVNMSEYWPELCVSYLP